MGLSMAVVATRRLRASRGGDQEDQPVLARVTTSAQRGQDRPACEWEGVADHLTGLCDSTTIRMRPGNNDHKSPDA